MALGFMLAIIRSFRAQDWLPTAIIVPDSSKITKSNLELVYGTNVVRTGERFALKFDTSVLNTPTASNGTDLTQLTESSIKQSIPRPQDTTAITKSLCALELLTGLPNLGRVAAHQGVVPRTLQRRLREQGVTFRQIAVEAIMEKADELVVQSDWPVYRIALHLGYAETSQFSRAYKSRTGVSPQEMRRLVGIGQHFIATE